MRTVTLLLFQISLASCCIAQRTDSIKHANGYLYFHEYGKGEPIVLLNGGPGASYLQLEEVALTLGKRYRVILPEQRGTGRSKPQPYDTSTINLRTALEDLSRLLNHLKLSDAQFMGHSWGGMLAMSYASKFPGRVKSLILLDPGPFSLDPKVFQTYSANQDARLSPNDKKKKDSALKKMQSPGATQEDSAAYFKWELVPVLYDRNKVDSLIIKINKGGLNPRMGLFIFQSLYKEKYDLSKSLSKFPKPVHIVSGSQDPAGFIGYEIKLLLPHTKLYWINQSGHFPMYEQPEQFYSTLFKIMDGRN